MWNCLNFIEEEKLLKTNVFQDGRAKRPYSYWLHPQIFTLSFTTKALINIWAVKIIITNNYHWIRRKVRKISNKPPKRPYQDKTLTKSAFICFIDVHRNI